MLKTVRIASFIGALVIVLFAAFDHDPRFDIKLAWSAYRAGDLDQAQRLARLAGLLAPRDSREWASAQELRARAAVVAQRPGAARELLDSLLAQSPAHRGGLLLRGELKLNAGDAVGALRDLDQALPGPVASGRPYSSQDAAHLARRGQAYLQTGNPKAAVADIKTALKLNPNQPEALYAASLVLEKQGRYLAALKYQERALYLANRKGAGFMLSPRHEQWTRHLIILRGKAKVPRERPFLPES